MADHSRFILNFQPDALLTKPIFYLEGLPELVGYDVVEQRVDGGGDVVEDAADVRKDVVSGYHARRGVLSVYGQEPLGVKGRPANKERHDDRH